MTMTPRRSFCVELARLTGGEPRRGPRVLCQSRGRSAVARVLPYVSTVELQVDRIVVEARAHAPLEVSCLPAELLGLVPWVAAWCQGRPVAAADLICWGEPEWSPYWWTRPADRLAVEYFKEQARHRQAKA